MQLHQRLSDVWLQFKHENGMSFNATSTQDGTYKTSLFSGTYQFGANIPKTQLMIRNQTLLVPTTPQQTYDVVFDLPYFYKIRLFDINDRPITNANITYGVKHPNGKSFQRSAEQIKDELGTYQFRLETEPPLSILYIRIPNQKGEITYQSDKPNWPFAERPLQNSPAITIKVPIQVE